MSANIRGGYTVRPHVQAFADTVEAHGWADSFGTYAGHDPTPERALDIFVAVVTDRNVRTPGDDICDFVVANAARFGVWYVMYRQRIWNVERAGEGWRPQSPLDRGSLTANHYDHVHVSFYESGDATPEEEDEMASPFDPDHNERDALIRDLANGLAEWKTGKLPSPLLGQVLSAVNDLSERVAALEDRAPTTTGTFNIGGQLKIYSGPGNGANG